MSIFANTIQSFVPFLIPVEECSGTTGLWKACKKGDMETCCTSNDLFVIVHKCDVFVSPSQCNKEGMICFYGGSFSPIKDFDRTSIVQGFIWALRHVEAQRKVNLSGILL
mmetsp:Transcript_16973/g.25920  ORF Transcript_16973/g.25920 Transcript_16973/m.25920 type:complete len:110 (+) Transcript_16973:513-842(+)